jgi:hypothetical protein
LTEEGKRFLEAQVEAHFHDNILDAAEEKVTLQQASTRFGLEKAEAKAFLVGLASRRGVRIETLEIERFEELLRAVLKVRCLEPAVLSGLARWGEERLQGIEAPSEQVGALIERVLGKPNWFDGLEKRLLSQVERAASTGLTPESWSSLCNRALSAVQAKGASLATNADLLLAPFPKGLEIVPPSPTRAPQALPQPVPPEVSPPPAEGEVGRLPEPPEGEKSFGQILWGTLWRSLALAAFVLACFLAYRWYSASGDAPPSASAAPQSRAQETSAGDER